MNKQINLRLPRTVLVQSEKYAKEHGFNTVQEFIKETVRERLFEISKEEEKLIKKLIEVSERKKLYGTEKELFKKLRRR